MLASSSSVIMKKPKKNPTFEFTIEKKIWREYWTDGGKTFFYVNESFEHTKDYVTERKRPPGFPAPRPAKHADEVEYPNHPRVTGRVNCKRPRPSESPDESPAAGPGTKRPHIDTGNSLLSQLASGHGKWPLGALAELIHNASDAGATRVRIRQHGPKGALKGLRIDDNGSGIGHGESGAKSESGVASGMYKLVQIAADKAYGSGKVGQVGGYGVGAKIGMMAVAHSAVIFSLGKSKTPAGAEIETVSVALISNHPFESAGEPFILEFVTLQSTKLPASNLQPVDGISTKEGKMGLFEKIKRVDPSINYTTLTHWQGAFEDRGEGYGTTVFLIGLRCLKFPATWVLSLDNPEEPTDIVVKSVRAGGGDPVHFDGSLMQRRSEPAPMDYSFRSFLSMMFHNKSDLDIHLFGVPPAGLVDRVCHAEALSFIKQGVTITVPGNGEKGKHAIPVIIGSDQKHRDSAAMYGVHVYCEGTLIVAYVQHCIKLPEEFADGHFGTILIVDFKKDSGILPWNTKINMDWEQNGEVWAELRQVFTDYVDERRRALDVEHPYRGPFGACIKDMRTRFEFKFGSRDPAGPVIGVLTLPEHEAGQDEDADSEGTFLAHARKHWGQKKEILSFETIKGKIKACRYISKQNKDTARFKRHVNGVLACSIAYHSQRWTADNDRNTTSGTQEELAGAKSRPYMTASTQSSNGKANSFTIRAILNEKGIPPEFEPVTLQENADVYGLQSVTEELDFNTTILLPHHKDVEAVVFLKSLQNEFAETFFPRAKEQLEEIKRAQAMRGDAVTNTVQCESCQKWRKLGDAAHKKYSAQEAIFRCEMVERRCAEKCDSNADDVVVDAQAERLRVEELERQKKREAERKAAEEAERQRKAKELERKKKLEAERKAAEEAERQRKAKELERQKKLEAERKKAEEAERQRKAKEEQLRLEELEKKLPKSINGFKSEIEKAIGTKSFQNALTLLKKLFEKSVNADALNNEKNKEAIRYLRTLKKLKGDVGAVEADLLKQINTVARNGLSAWKRISDNATYPPNRAPGGQAVKVPQELQPSALTHYPLEISRLARELQIPRTVFPDLPVCLKSAAGRCCVCHQTWINFAAEYHNEAKALKNKIADWKGKILEGSAGASKTVATTTTTITPGFADGNVLGLDVATSGDDVVATGAPTTAATAAAAASALGPAAAAAAGTGDGGSPAPGSATTASQLLAVVTVTPGVADNGGAADEGAAPGGAGASAVARISSAALNEAQPAAGLTSTQTFQPLGTIASRSPPGSTQKNPMVISDDEDDDGEVAWTGRTPPGSGSDSSSDSED